ncbi:hypothetical protein HOLleu_41966 [Holothuria leucospilota]|uniref:Uncharacterized protein n=1 Tax=Holothuria leucospilota TaxID=206669 RepID=A0A9Q0YE76_HOLLE|nr:hypothetical protein HOLleu_41966 [Holothuria leucospilota]
MAFHSQVVCKPQGKPGTQPSPIASPKCLWRALCPLPPLATSLIPTFFCFSSCCPLLKSWCHHVTGP